MMNLLNLANVAVCKEISATVFQKLEKKISRKKEKAFFLPNDNFWKEFPLFLFNRSYIDTVNQGYEEISLYFKELRIILIP